ncbi:hypothetical protein [Ornithinimicrobium pratense]|uniref:DUF998 domain-containing protein n=1 Tax=Ornithinimicrobium pratense TaxID=2593973 RepID=A0A5J6V2Z4_9MICO|nr:hypothetical protein [Ornithinimicrobium pratense]QFG68095.1 hypothetical protein FY030_04635 [Ornithinimicrobium pratense]
MAPESHTQVLRLTYANLRWLLVLLPAVLFVVTVGAAIQQGHLETSISGYYGGPVRDVFVGVMIGVAVLLLAYQGATYFEDYNLGGAGFYAVFVALVPTGLAETLAGLRSGVSFSGQGISAAEYVWSLRFSLTVVALLALALFALELRARERMRALVTGDPISLVFVVVTGGTLLSFLGLAMWQLWAPPVEEVTMEGLRLTGLPVVGEVQLRVHDLAAIFLICALAVAVWSHAWPRAAARRSRERLESHELVYLAGYRVIFVLMVLGPLVAWGIARTFAPGHLVIFLEWWEIALFCLFWVVETRRQARLLSAPPSAPLAARSSVPSAAPSSVPLMEPASSSKTMAPEATSSSSSSSVNAANCSSESST